ncbi:hypothetical protein [Pseudobacteriovorax antillogorgiicola]|nr:hypothetical protein [Pseudobacteriovorax antillogorgiicola]
MSWSKLNRQSKIGILMSLFGIVGWGLVIVSIYVFSFIFDSPANINFIHFALVPGALVFLGCVLNTPFIIDKLSLSPKFVTLCLTAAHGIWGQFAGLQANPEYNGFVLLFLFSFGLLYIKSNFGFSKTLAFALANLLLAIVLIYALSIDFGVDEKLFLFFFAFSGISTAINNAVHHRKSREYSSLRREVTHSSNEVRKVLYPHQVSMISGGQLLEETMPVKEGAGCCLIFQINDSSSVKHEQAQCIFRELFSNFSRMILAEGQDHRIGEGPVVDAYRVSEFGDKFVCTIGFPFACSEDQSPSELALTLAEKFNAKFLELITGLSYPRHISCTITITRGQLEGYYTQGLPVEYQLYGEALIVAERINELRSQLSQALQEDRSLLIIQELVYNSLPNRVRDQFQVLTLQDHGLILRGASHNKQVFHRLLDEPQILSNSA